VIDPGYGDPGDEMLFSVLVAGWRGWRVFSM